MRYLKLFKVICFAGLMAGSLGASADSAEVTCPSYADAIAAAQNVDIGDVLTQLGSKGYSGSFASSEAFWLLASKTNASASNSWTFEAVTFIKKLGRYASIHCSSLHRNSSFSITAELFSNKNLGFTTCSVNSQEIPGNGQLVYVPVGATLVCS